MVVRSVGPPLDDGDIGESLLELDLEEQREMHLQARVCAAAITYASAVATEVIQTFWSFLCRMEISGQLCFGPSDKYERSRYVSGLRRPEINIRSSLPQPQTLASPFSGSLFLSPLLLPRFLHFGSPPQDVLCRHPMTGPTTQVILQPLRSLKELAESTLHAYRWFAALLQLSSPE